MAQVCAIVLNYFGAQKTQKCLKSLIGQAVDTIYIADNSASEVEAHKLLKLSEELSGANSSPLIRLLINEDNLGFGKAMNRALKNDIGNYGGHKFYILMNNDVEATPHMIKSLRDIMNQQEDISLLAPRMITRNGETGFFWYNKLFGAITFKKMALSFPFLTGCCLMFKRSLIENEPLFDEDFFMYGEDVYLSWRLQNAGQKIVCTDDIQILHEGTGSSHHGNFFYEYHTARGHILFALKAWKHFYELPLFILGRILYLSTRAFIRSLRYFNLTPVYAFFLCWMPLRIRIIKK